MYNVSLIIEYVSIVHYVYWVYVCVFCTLSSVQSVNMYCPYVNCCCFLHCLSICKLLLFFFCTVCPYVNCCCFFLHCLEHCKGSSAVFLHCLSICKLLLLFFCTVCPYVNCLLFFCTVCPYVNCLLFFCTVWSTLIRISLTKALVLWWCDNKSDLIWFDLNQSHFSFI